LLTYSQADLQKVADCKAFSKIVIDAFGQGTCSSKIEQWATNVEDHADGGKHFHMIIKLSKPRRWRPVFEHMRKSHGIVVNFSSNSCGYLAGYRYVCKEKDFITVLHCPDHPNLRVTRSPNAKKAFKKYSKNSKKRQSEGAASCSTSAQKKRRLSNRDVVTFIIESNLRKESEFLTATRRRQANGLSDIYDFILNRSPKALSDLIETAWKLVLASIIVMLKRKQK
jgi:hypothetical protein